MLLRPLNISRNFSSVSSQLSGTQPLTVFESVLKYGVGTLLLPVILPKIVDSVDPLHHDVLTNFGKYDKTFNTGLYVYPWLVGTKKMSVFMGPRTFKLDTAHILDAQGNPLHVSAIVNYRVVDAAVYGLKLDGNVDYIKNKSETVLREFVSKFSYNDFITEQQGDKVIEHFLQDHHIPTNFIVQKHNNCKILLQQNLIDTGVEIMSFSICEFKYAPEIASSMLVKQQAQAYITAKRDIVEGVVSTIKDVIKEFPELSQPGKEKLVTTLLPVLSSGQSVQPTLNVL